MYHLRNCIESVKFEHVHDEMLLCNLKRKIEEDPTEIIDNVKRQYSVHYSPTKIRSLSLRKDSNGGTTLYDDDCQQARFAFPVGLKPLLIPPVGCKKIIPYDYSNVQITLPHLPKDALVSIFKCLPGWELLPMRLVCKRWNTVLKTTHSLWKLHIVRSPDKWCNLSPFKTYLLHMFLEIRDMSRVYGFFLRNPKFFTYIVGLLLGHTDLGPILIGKDEISIKGYLLHRKRGLTDEGRWVDMDTFLDAYRQTLV
jgi:hypothetical protein